MDQPPKTKHWTLPSPSVTKIYHETSMWAQDTYAHTTQDAIVFVKNGPELVAGESGSDLQVVSVKNMSYTSTPGSGDVSRAPQGAPGNRHGQNGHVCFQWKMWKWKTAAYCVGSEVTTGSLAFWSGRRPLQRQTWYHLPVYGLLWSAIVAHDLILNMLNVIKFSWLLHVARDSPSPLSNRSSVARCRLTHRQPTWFFCADHRWLCLQLPSSKQTRLAAKFPI